MAPTQAPPTCAPVTRRAQPLLSTGMAARANSLPIRVVGRPVATSGLARIILQLHQQRLALQLVTTPTNEQLRRTVPALEQGSV